MPISETAVQFKTTLARLEGTTQIKFDAGEVAKLRGVDKHTVLYHIRHGKLDATKATTKSGRPGYVVTRGALRAYLAARV